MADLARIDELAQPRAIEHLAPGSWWEVDYQDQKDGPLKTIWARVQRVAHYTHRVNGSKFVQVIGIDTEGDLCELMNVRGTGIPRTLKKAEASKVGLLVPGDPL
jgi:hypothetical protein